MLHINQGASSNYNQNARCIDKVDINKFIVVDASKDVEEIQVVDERTFIINIPTLFNVYLFLRGLIQKENINAATVVAGGRARDVSRVRLYLAKKLVGEYGLTRSQTSRLLGVSTSAICKALARVKGNKPY